MPRPRKSRRHEFYDLFADFDLADQAIVIEFLQEQHRQNVRAAARLNRAPLPNAEQVMRAGAETPSSAGELSGSSPSFPAHPLRLPTLSCRYCAEGNPRVRSSVSEAYVHTDTPIGRVVCKAEPPI